jgi:DNA-binding CsgD family transcriptional regulator
MTPEGQPDSVPAAGNTPLRKNALAMLDELGVGALLFDAGAQPLGETWAARILLDSDDDGATIRATALRLASARVSERSVEVVTPAGRYELRRTQMPPQLVGSAVGAIIIIRTDTLRPPSDDQLRADYRLTAREVEVARLIARGINNAAVALTLGISPHTAERHTERVLHKLRAQSRAAVAALLLTPGPVGSSPDATVTRLPDR